VTDCKAYHANYHEWFSFEFAYSLRAEYAHDDASVAEDLSCEVGLDLLARLDTLIHNGNHPIRKHQNDVDP